MPGFLDFHGFSIHGDPRWYGASRLSRWAPIVVIWIFVFSVLEIVVGSIWLVQLATDMEIAKIFHTLIIPGLSFFNAVPSLHLHMLLRKNPPRLSIWSSSIFASMYLIMSMLLTISCSLDPASVSLSLRQNLCADGRTGDKKGPSPTIWASMVAFYLVSFVLYTLHGFMASQVLRVTNKEKAEKRANPQNNELSSLSPAEVERARQLWRNQERYGL